ncbi:MAG: aminoacyl-tRNA hydrolase [Planctomycetota bacterium]
MKLVAGLGNPGARYESTRHNVGFDVVDLLVRRFGAAPQPAVEAGLFACTYQGEELLLLKPGEYMNRSGGPVGRVAQRYEVQPAAVLVVYDDLDLVPGRLRVRASGSAGGHRGLQDIADRFSAEVHRLRIGIGRPPSGRAVEEYVLESFDESQHELLAETIERAAEAAVCWLENGVVAAANQFNASVPSAEVADENETDDDK